MNKLEQLFSNVAMVYTLAVDVRGRPPNWEEFTDTVLRYLAEMMGAYGTAVPRKVIDPNYRTAANWFLKTEILTEAFVSCPWVLERMWKILRGATWSSAE